MDTLTFTQQLNKKKNGFPKKLGLMFGIDFLSGSLKSIIQGHADRHTTWYTFVKL